MRGRRGSRAHCGNTGNRRTSSRATDPDAVSGGVLLDALADLVHHADDLVPEDERELRVGQLAVDDVEVGAADAARQHPDAQLSRAGLGKRQVLEDKRLARPLSTIACITLWILPRRAPRAGRSRRDGTDDVQAGGGPRTDAPPPLALDLDALEPDAGGVGVRDLVRQLDRDLGSLGDRPGRGALEVLAEVLRREVGERAAPDPHRGDPEAPSPAATCSICRISPSISACSCTTSALPAVAPPPRPRRVRRPM